VNFSLALAETPREILIDGTAYVLVKRSALDALYPGRPVDRATRCPARPASRPISRPAPKKLKAPSSKPVARPAGAPDPEVVKPVSGALRAAVLATIQQNPGQTSLEIFDVIRHKVPTTTSGSVYQAIKSWVKKDLVKGQQTDEGTMGWHPRAASKAISSAAG
jgi:hypothetical protein